MIFFDENVVYKNRQSGDYKIGHNFGKFVQSKYIIIIAHRMLFKMTIGIKWDIMVLPIFNEQTK